MAVISLLYDITAVATFILLIYKPYTAVRQRRVTKVTIVMQSPFQPVDPSEWKRKYSWDIRVVPLVT